MKQAPFFEQRSVSGSDYDRATIVEMDTPKSPGNDPGSHLIPGDGKLTFWQKLGGGSLSISIIIHMILLCIAVMWIFQIVPEQKPSVDFMPKGGGGGQPGAKADVSMKKLATMKPLNAPRVVAKGATSAFTLPEPDPASTMTSIGALSSGGMSGGLGGSGSGGGKGDGKGSGFGSGTGMGLGGAAGPGMNPFGMLNPNANALVGVLYDTKQDDKRKPIDMTPGKLGEIIRDFTGHGWNERSLSGKFFQAPRKLYQSRVYIPLMGAEAAPKAFDCEKEVQPSRWLVVYRGNIQAPKSGEFRFVGASDDVLVVRFNKQNVFDHGFYKGTDGLRRSGKKDAAILYKYPGNGHYNDNIGGFEVGPEFDVREGSTYPIEILLAEIPGGYFGASLMIQETGVEYQKTSTGAPILPLFRLDNSPPPARAANAPEFDPNGPIWKLVDVRGKLDI